MQNPITQVLLQKVRINLVQNIISLAGESWDNKIKTSLTIGKRMNWCKDHHVWDQNNTGSLSFILDKILYRIFTLSASKPVLQCSCSNFEILLGDYSNPFQVLRGLPSVCSSTWWVYYFGIHTQFLCQDVKRLLWRSGHKWEKSSFELVTSLMNLSELYCEVTKGWNESIWTLWSFLYVSKNFWK